jgi:hypothetical protein
MVFFLVLACSNLNHIITMKKIYVLAALFAAFSTASFAQRSIDWSITETIKPTELLSNESSGTQWPIHIVLKNLGADLAKAGDTLVYQFVIGDANSNPLVYFPSQTQLAIKVLSRDVAKDDTIHLVQNLNFGLYTRNSSNMNFLAVCYLWNRGATDPITTEAVTTNNRITTPIVWWNPYKNGVGINDLNTSLLKVYPNPALNNVTISWPLTSTGANATITVTDIQGKVVISTEMSSFTGAETLNVAELKSGMYMVEVSAGDVKMTEKLQIIK